MLVLGFYAGSLALMTLAGLLLLGFGSPITTIWG